MQPRLNSRVALAARIAHIARAVLPMAALAASLAACVAGPNFVAPAAPAAGRYSADPLPNLAGSDSTPDSALAAPAQWWALLNAPRLDSTIREALAANRSLEAARGALAEAR